MNEAFRLLPILWNYDWCPLQCLRKIYLDEVLLHTQIRLLCCYLSTCSIKEGQKFRPQIAWKHVHIYINNKCEIWINCARNILAVSGSTQLNKTFFMKEYEFRDLTPKSVNLPRAPDIGMSLMERRAYIHVLSIRQASSMTLLGHFNDLDPAKEMQVHLTTYSRHGSCFNIKMLSY